MLVLGIVGGVASGKSLVSAALERLGAAVIEGDRLGHEVLLEPHVIAAAQTRWGTAVLSPDGQLSRKAIAQRVFGATAEAKQELKFLEELTHPRIASKMREKISELATRGDVDVVVLDAALLLEAGWHDVCEQIWFVDVPREMRAARAKTRGWSEADFAAREAAQWPLAEKIAHADRVIDNSGPPEKTIHQIEKLWPELVS